MKPLDGKFAVIGAGSWGTALAIQLARSGPGVVLWGRDADQIAACTAARNNKRYLPNAPFPDTLAIEPDLEQALHGAEDVLVSVPSHAFRGMLQQLLPLFGPHTRLCWATKGFELSTGKLPHVIAAEVLGEDRPRAVLSGPTFAKEVGVGLPTALTIAASVEDYAVALAERVSGATLRAYTSTDLIGVEVGGAVKNILAIGAGLSDGLGFGANSRVALITRGLSEMTRLGVALGAKAETFMGLAGMGDLVLTCTDDQSRNRRMGLALASGQSVAEASKEIRQVVEGVTAARAVHQVAQAVNVEMPICEQIYKVLYQDLAPDEAVLALMQRGLRREHD